MSGRSTGLSDELTPREHEVLSYLRLGYTNAQIAQKLDISANGVKYHVSEIMGKLGVRNRKEAALWPNVPRPWWAVAFAPIFVFWRRLSLPSAGAIVNVTGIAVLAGALVALGVGLFFVTSSSDAPGARGEGKGEIEWLRQFGTSNFIRAPAIAADETGVYVAGVTEGTLPGQTQIGFADAFVRKYDRTGNELWTRQFGVPGSDAPSGSTSISGIATDATGVYVAGQTSGALSGQTSAGGADAFVRKYDQDGNELWIRQFGSSSTDLPTGIASDPTGVYVAGWTHGALPGQMQIGFQDGFVRKYDQDGNGLWTRQFGNSSVQGIASDDTGVYVIGIEGFFGPLPEGIRPPPDDPFIRKYGHDGKELWTRELDDSASAIASDGTGVYVVESTQAALPGQTTAPTSMPSDAFVQKYNQDGDELWLRRFETLAIDTASAVVADGMGIYVAGGTDGTLPGQTKAGGGDAYVRAYDPDGNAIWTRQFGSSGEEHWTGALGLASDGAGVYLVGGTDGTLPGQTRSSGPYEGDAFVAKLVAPGP